MAFYRCGGKSSTGATGATGTISMPNANTVYTINTGLSSISKFILHAHGTGSYAESFQGCVRWESTSSGYFYQTSASKGSSNTTANRSAVSTSATASRGMVVYSVSGGTVKIRTATTSSWVLSDCMWIAV